MPASLIACSLVKPRNLWKAMNRRRKARYGRRPLETREPGSVACEHRLSALGSFVERVTAQGHKIKRTTVDVDLTELAAAKKTLGTRTNRDTINRALRQVNV